MLVEQEGVLFIGAPIFAGLIPFVGDADSSAWLTAIERLSKFDPRIMVGGHGPPSRQASENLGLRRNYLLYLRKTMGEAVDESFIRRGVCGNRLKSLCQIPGVRCSQ